MTKKTFILFYLSMFLLNFQVFSQGNCELVIENKNSGYYLYVSMYPISMVFNGAKESGMDRFGYNLIARQGINYNHPPEPTYRADFIGAMNVENDQRVIIRTLDKYGQGTSSFCLQHDAENLIGSALAVFGYGKYRIDLWYDAIPFPYYNDIPPDDFLTIEFDANYGLPSVQWYDLRIKWYGPNDIRYSLGVCEDIPLPPNRNIEVWNPCPQQTRQKNKGDFKYDAGTIETPNPYTTIPLDPRRECTDSYLIGAPNQKHEFLRNDIGVLTLKLTIEKNVTTPVAIWSEEYPAMPPIVIANGGSLIIDKSNVTGQERTFTFKRVPYRFLGTDLKIEAGGVMDLQVSPTESERVHVKFEDYCNSEIEHQGTLRLKTNSQMELTGNSQMIWYPNSVIVFIGSSLVPNNYGRMVLKNTSRLTNCGANIIGPLTLTQEAGNYRVIHDCSLPLSGEPFESLVDSGGSIIVKNSASLEVGSGGKLIFDGAESHLQLEQGSIVNLGTGASIEFRNGAYIEADGCTFTSTNSGEISSGVKLIGAGSNSIIQNCTFNDANIAIDVQNTSCTILNNTINIPTAELGAVGINTSNVTSITIQHNTINIGSNASATGINMLNYDGDGLAGGIGVPTYALNVINNFINGGSYPLSISCLTANRLPFLIKGNIITPLTGITNYGIFAYNISGNIKNNIYSNNLAANSLALQQCDVNLFDNSFLSGSSTTMLLQSGTTARMAPIQDENGQWLWIGGNNSFNSNSSNNIGFTLGSNPIVSPFGSNCFYLGTMPNYFITGEFCGGRSYNAYENYWEPTPTSGTYNILCSGTPQYVNYTPYYTECPMIIGGTSTGYVVEDAGNGIYDTVYTSPSEGGEGGSVSSVSKKSTITEGRLYYEALTKRRQHDYAGAIGKCKDIINSNDSSDYFISALSELYLNYQQSDTIDNQNITSGLFNNLKTYLEQKMAQYANNPVFVEKAYKFVLMCLVKSKNYTEALAGYENVMNNHPDPITRLNASWDRSAVVLLMGQGSSVSSNFKQNSLNRLLDNKPSHRIAKDVFKSAKENELAGNERSSQRKYTQEEKAELNSRIEKYNPISNKDLKEKLLSDIRLVNTINSVNRSAEDNNTLSPRRFTLYQNYPNPFNPATMIKYDIPKDAVVKIKIYDILGKQVFGLDEFKKAGSYEVRFDGGNLASGMYFYSVEANGFKETKKMVLLK